jgi:hypothetical protein
VDIDVKYKTWFYSLLGKTKKAIAGAPIFTNASATVRARALVWG